VDKEIDLEAGAIPLGWLCDPETLVTLRGTTRLTSAAIGEVLNRVCDVVIG
jgi:hypothetical protein